jgi:hypothetical protein
MEYICSVIHGSTGKKHGGYGSSGKYTNVLAGELPFAKGRIVVGPIFNAILCISPRILQAKDKPLLLKQGREMVTLLANATTASSSPTTQTFPRISTRTLVPCGNAHTSV